MLVVKDKQTGYLTANLVPRKGADPFAIRSLNRGIGKLMGHKNTIMRSDQELAIKDLKNKLKKVSVAGVAMEETLVGDSITVYKKPARWSSERRMTAALHAAGPHDTWEHDT